jgi:hypothetical protein
MKKFKELREHSLEEKLKASDPAGKYISDFVHSDNPKFEGKSKSKRIQMALAASYAAKGKSKNEEVESVEEGRNDTPVPYGSLSNRPSSATVAQTGPRKGMITKKHATRLKDRIKASLNKEEVESIEEANEPPKHYGGKGVEGAKFDLYMQKRKQQNTAMKPKSVEEGVMNAVKNLAKKASKALTGGSDEDQRKDLQRKMGVPQTGKKPMQK